MAKNLFEEMKVKGTDLVNKVKDLVHEGNVRRIIIKNDKDQVLLEIPLTFGILGALLAPTIAAVAAVGSLALNYKIEVQKQAPDEKQEASKPEKQNKEE